MSDALILILDKQIPRNFLGRELILDRGEYSRECAMYIERAEYIIKHLNADGNGYPIGGWSYIFWRDDGEGFYCVHLSAYVKKTDIPQYKKELKWVHDTIEELLDLDYDVKMFNGNIHSDIEEVFIATKTLDLAKLLDTETVLDYNVLYEIKKE